MQALYHAWPMSRVAPTYSPERGSFGPSVARRGAARAQWALSRLSTHAATRRRSFRSAVAGGALVAVSSAVTIGALGVGSASDVTDVLALRTLAYASWLFGALGLWAFCATPSPAESNSVQAVERGFSPRDVERSWTFGVAARVAASVFAVTVLPLAVSIATSPSSSLLASRLLLVPGVALYSLLFGASIALLARLTLSLVPGAPRLTLALIVLLPFVASFWFDGVPSVPGAFGWLIARLVHVGGWGA